MIIEVIGISGSGKSTLSRVMIKKLGNSCSDMKIVYPDWKQEMRDGGYKGKLTARGLKEAAHITDAWRIVLRNHRNAYEDLIDVARKYHEDPNDYLITARKWLCVWTLWQYREDICVWDKGLVQVLVKFVARTPVTKEDFKSLIWNWPQSDRYVHIQVDRDIALKRAKNRDAGLKRWTEATWHEMYDKHEMLYSLLRERGANVVSVDNNGTPEEFDFVKALPDH